MSRLEKMLQDDVIVTEVNERYETKEELYFLVGEARTETLYSMTSYEIEHDLWN